MTVTPERLDQAEAPQTVMVFDNGKFVLVGDYYKVCAERDELIAEVRRLKDAHEQRTELYESLFALYETQYKWITSIADFLDTYPNDARPAVDKILKERDEARALAEHRKTLLREESYIAARYREALEWYANPEQNSPEDYEQSFYMGFRVAIPGKRARAALAGEGDKDA